MNLIKLSYLVLNLNAAIDAGDTATLDEAKVHIRSGDVFDWLRTAYKLGVSLLQNPDSRDGRDIVAGLQEILWRLLRRRTPQVGDSEQRPLPTTCVDERTYPTNGRQREARRLRHREYPRDLRRHWPIVTVMRGPRRFKPELRLDTCKVDQVPRLGGQLFKILKLGAAVAFAERVNIVHVAHDRPRRLGEGASAQPPQEVRLLKPPVDVGHAGFDELAKLELAPVLGDLHGAEFAGPRVQVLKQVPVDGAKVG